MAVRPTCAVLFATLLLSGCTSIDLGRIDGPDVPVRGESMSRSVPPSGRISLPLEFSEPVVAVIRLEALTGGLDVALTASNQRLKTWPQTGLLVYEFAAERPHALDLACQSTWTACDYNLTVEWSPESRGIVETYETRAPEPAQMHAIFDRTPLRLARAESFQQLVDIIGPSTLSYEVSSTGTPFDVCIFDPAQSTPWKVGDPVIGMACRGNVMQASDAATLSGSQRVHVGLRCFTDACDLTITLRLTA